MLGATKRSHNNLTCLVLFQSSISFVVVVVVVVVVVAYTLPVVVVVDAGLVVESRVAIGHVVLGPGRGGLGDAGGRICGGRRWRRLFGAFVAGWLLLMGRRRRRQRRR